LKTQLQLEKECDKLRNELQQKSMLNHVTTETTGQMLERIRGEQLRQDDAEVKAKNEMERLRQLHETTLVNIPFQKLIPQRFHLVHLALH